MSAEQETVLVVEDDPGVATLQRKSLARAGYRVLTAATAAEAAEVVARGGVDLIILDFGLPDNVTGLDLYAQLKAAGHDPPVIMVTGLSNEATIIQALREGVRDFVSKSVEYLDYLPSAVGRVLQQARMKEALRKSEERFQFIARATNDAVCDWNLVTGDVWWNDGFYLLFGYRREEVEPHADWWSARIHPEDRIRVRHGTEAVIGGGDSSWSDEYRLQRGDGSYSDVLHRGCVIRDLSGAPLRMIGSMMDMTQRKQAENALRESNDRFLAIAQSANDAIISADGEGRIIFWNAAAQRMFHYSEPEALGQPVTLLMPERYQPLHTAALARARAGAPSQLVGKTVELYGRRKDGSEFPLELSPARWETKAGVFHSAILRDITERKRAEAALEEKEQQFRQSQKLEAVGQLAGGVAHEYNNLLQAILSFTEFATESLPPENPAGEDLRQVTKAAERAAALTRQLLGFSRCQPLQRSRLRPNEVIADLLKMLRPLIGANIDVRTDLSQGVGVVDADSALLQQMLLNLCVNARDAMPEGGRLTVKTEDIILDPDDSDCFPDAKPGWYLLLTIADTGCGMSPEVRARLFEPFFTTKEIGKGTGLGLAMVYGVVQQHGGMIHVSSEPGLGTTFRIYLPTADSAPSTGNSEAPAAIAGGQETILVADDEPFMRDIARRVLQRAGYAVLTAADGQEAMRLLEEEGDEISLALLDVVMPRGGGREIYRQIREMRPEMPVIFCSGYDPDTGRTEFIAAEQLVMLQKPFDPKLLLRTVREELDAAPSLAASSSGVATGSCGNG